jgi:PAS domain S-box-containing protein
LNRQLIRSHWRSHLPPLLAGAVAVFVLFLSPFWTYQWAQVPFLGISLEQNNVVSQINGTNWPARTQGVKFKDRLMELNGKAVPDIQDVQRVLSANGYQPIQATFQKPDGQTYSISITPIRPPFADVISLFVIPYIVGLSFLIIGFWAYRIKPDLWESRALALFVSGLCVMVTTFLDISMTHHASILWSFGILQAAGGLFYLALVFPQPVRFVRSYPRLRYLPWLFIGLLAPIMVIAIYFPPTPFFYITAWQIGYVLFILSFIFLIAMLIWRIGVARSPIIRQQSRVILFGSFLGFLPAIIYVGSLIAGILIEFQAWIVFPSLVLFPLSITYAILRYRLLDVDAILVRAVTYIMMTIVVIATFYGLLALLSFAFEETIQANNPLVIASYLFILVIGLTPLRNLIQNSIDRVFYRAPADYRRALSALSRALVVTPNLTQTLRLLENQIQQAIAPEKFTLHLYNDDLGEYIPHATREDSAPPYELDNPLVHLIESSQAPIWLPPDGPVPTLLQNTVNDYRRLMGFTFVPLRYKTKLIGFMSLGPRRSGDLYNSNDLDFLAAVADQSTLALENARLFENLRRTLDQTLEMKNLMDDIFSSIATGIITTDLKKNITLFNRAAENIFGIPVKNVLGKSLANALPRLYAELDNTTSSVSQQNVINLSTERSSTLPEHSNLYLRLSLSPLRDARLDTKGTTIVFEDLTERHQIEAERERIRQTFGRVVAPRVRDRLLADAGNLALDGRKQVITVLFADLSGFTPFSEKNEPETVFSVLNSYLSIAAQAILEQEGTLDKFMGDAVLAIWNSPDEQPDHALRAVRAAREIIRRAFMAHNEFPDPDQRMAFRIGITTGEAIIGNVGTNELFNYTAIGDIVNLAQRLQSSAKSGEILIEKTTYDIVAEHVQADAIQQISVKGREQIVQAYTIKDIK